MARVIHFEINADQPQRAADFYQGVFGWKITKWEGPQDYWLISTGEAPEPGIDGAITGRMGPGIQTVNTASINDLDEAVARVLERGGQIVMPRMAVTGIGYLAYCQDTEGNIFGMMQMDPSAA